MTNVSDTLHGHLLWVAVVWPLLLASPWRRMRDSWFRYSAVLPAAVLTLWPGDASFALPHFMLGMGLGAESQTRLLLAMSITVWLAAALAERLRPSAAIAPYRGSTFLLLTLAGSIGAVLSADIVAYFLFSAFMGYSFYGAFIDGAEEPAQRGGRIYIVLMIIADQFLFEAMLIAASATSDLRFPAVRQAVANTDLAHAYVLYAVAGFALKAGLWPVHWWLPLGYRSASRPAAFLFGGVPVAMALLGAVRWLPLGTLSDYSLGAALLVLGLAGAAYGAQTLIRFPTTKSMPASMLIVATGTFAAFLGRALEAPSTWEHYGNLAQTYIASLGILSMVLTFARTALWPHARPSGEPIPESPLARAQWLTMLLRWSEEASIRLRSCRNTLALKTTALYRQEIWRKPMSDSVTRWDGVIALFVLLGLLLAWLSMP